MEGPGMERLQSLFGVCVIMGLAWALAPRGRHRNVRPQMVLRGAVLLFAIALLVLRSPARVVFDWANDGVERLLAFTLEGSRFLFGKLTDAEGFGFVFAFQVLPTIVFFGALMSMLYHLRILPFVIQRIGRGLSRFLGTTGPESFSTAADVFVGQTEAPLVIRPYIINMSDEEIFACMTAGFATTAGGVLAAYVSMLGPHVPGIAGHLIACSVMCAPAALVVSKLMYSPPRDEGLRASEVELTAPQASTNLVDAIASGTLDGMHLALNVGAMLVAFVALTAAVDYGFAALGNAIGMKLTLSQLAGYVFAPLAWLIGVPAGEVSQVGSLLGQKMVLNEFVAYAQLSSELAKDPGWLSERARLLAAYALCGFANFGSIGIQIGGYTALVPERRALFAQLAFRAMIAGTLTTCLVAAVAGVVL
jgi:CNT family concentrative nucleoside transporter